MDQILIDNRDVTSSSDGPDTRRQSRVFHRPFALDTAVNFNTFEKARGIHTISDGDPLNKGGEGDARSFNCPPRMAGSCLAHALVWIYGSSFLTQHACYCFTSVFYN